MYAGLAVDGNVKERDLQCAVGIVKAETPYVARTQLAFITPSKVERDCDQNDVCLDAPELWGELWFNQLPLPREHGLNEDVDTDVVKSVRA